MRRPAGLRPLRRLLTASRLAQEDQRLNALSIANRTEAAHPDRTTAEYAARTAGCGYSPPSR